MDTATRKEGYITPCAAALLLAVSVKTVYKLAASGELEVLRVGRSVRILAASLQDFIERNTVRVEVVEAPAPEPQPARRPAPRRSDGKGFIFLPPRS